MAGRRRVFDDHDSGLEETPAKRPAGNAPPQDAGADAVDGLPADGGGGGAQGNASGSSIPLNDPGHPGYSTKKTIKCTGSTWIKCDTGADESAAGIPQTRWHKIPWEWLDFWMTEEESNDLVNNYKYWKLDGVQKITIMNPQARVETISGGTVTQGLPNPLTEVQMYVDSMYETGVSQSPYVEGGQKLDRNEAIDIFRSFVNDGVWNGAPKMFGSGAIPTCWWHPNSPGVKKLTMSDNTPISASWRVNSPYWRSTEEMKCYTHRNDDPDGAEAQTTANAPQSLSYCRGDEHFGYIAPNRLTETVRVDNNIVYSTNAATFKAYGPNLKSKRQPIGEVQGFATNDDKLRTFMRANVCSVTRTVDAIAEIRPIGPISDLSVKYMCPDPVPNLWLRANTFVNSETNGIEPGIVRIDFKVEIPIICRGKRRTGAFGSSRLGFTSDLGDQAESYSSPYDHAVPFDISNTAIGPGWATQIYCEPVFIPLTRDLANENSNGENWRYLQM